MKKTSFIVSSLFVTGALLLQGSVGLQAAGTSSASFLDIPVGAGPAAMGSAYSALATDAYAPVWNPGALGFIDSTQIAGQHVAYLESISYEFLSFVHPLIPGDAIGVSAQYLGSGDIIQIRLAPTRLPMGTRSRIASHLALQENSFVFN
jgi:hypothetical protein